MAGKEETAEETAWRVGWGQQAPCASTFLATGSPVQEEFPRISVAAKGYCIAVF